MSDLPESPYRVPSFVPVEAGKDRDNEQRGLGISTVSFKVTSQDNDGLFVIEITFQERGGPARHLHYEQDEWFYCLEGEFIMEVGSNRMTLKPGDSIFAPRNIPHVWSYVGDPGGKMLFAFTPAGQMEAFFRKTTKSNAMPPQDPELWQAHGMQLVGPPLEVEF